MVMKFIPYLVAAVALYGVVRWFEWSQIFHPLKKMEGDPGMVGLDYDEVVFNAEDGCRLFGWWIPNEEAVGSVVYCHGNAGNISTRLDVYRGLHDLGLNVFVFDYRGYGISGGIPGEKGLYRDARAAYEVVRARHEDADEPPIMIYGASLGGAVAIHLASEKYCRGLVVEGGFLSAVDVGERWFPWLPIRLIARQRFDTSKIISTISTPKLFAHSQHDRVIPPDLGNNLFTAASAPKKFVSLNGEHGEAGWRDTPHFYTELRQFVDGIFPAR